MARFPHKFAFSYNITKPYPFRWFTPVAVIGFLVLAALFSFLNYVTSGFVLINENTNNPNGTEGAHGWMQHLPSYLTTNSKGICQPVTLPVGSTVFTNNSALTYTLQSAWQHGPNNTKLFAPSLPYKNNILEDCSVTGLQMGISNSDTLQENQIAFVDWGLAVNTYITCSFHGPHGKQMFDLTQQYNYVPETVPLAEVRSFLKTNFIARDSDAKASLWWGETLLSLAWDFLTFRMKTLALDQWAHDQTAISKVNLQYTPRPPPYEQSDIADLSFFRVRWQFSWTPDSPNEQPPAYWPVINESTTDAAWLMENNVYPNIWHLSDRLAKSAWSTVLTDLGQVSAKPNILTDAALLADWTAPLSYIEVGVNVINPIPGPATQPYGTRGYDTGPLGVTPSTISAEYLCQVPKRKAIGNLIITIVVADLVLLQTVWQLYKLIVDTVFLNTDYDQQASTQDGFRAIEDPTEEELKPMRRATVYP